MACLKAVQKQCGCLSARLAVQAGSLALANGISLWQLAWPAGSALAGSRS